MAVEDATSVHSIAALLTSLFQSAAHNHSTTTTNLHTQPQDTHAGQTTCTQITAHDLISAQRRAVHASTRSFSTPTVRFPDEPNTWQVCRSKSVRGDSHYPYHIGNGDSMIEIWKGNFASLRNSGWPSLTMVLWSFSRADEAKGKKSEVTIVALLIIVV